MSKKYLPVIILIILLGWAVYKFLPTRYLTKLDVEGFARLPVQARGRIQPMESLARNSLMIISGKQTVYLEKEKERLPAIAWLMQLTMQPEVAAQYPVFRIDNAEVLSLMKLPAADKNYFSFNELRDSIPLVLNEREKIPKEPSACSVFQNQLERLYNGLIIYDRLFHLLHTATDPSELELEYANWLASIEPGMKAIESKEKNEVADSESLRGFIYLANRYWQLSSAIPFAVVPPDPGQDEWANIGFALLKAIRSGKINPVVIDYAKLTNAFRTGDSTAFNTIIKSIQTAVKPHVNTFKLSFEVLFDQWEVFYVSTVIYLISFLLIIISLIFPKWNFQKAAYWVLVVGFLIHTFGLIARMYLQGRPPVTNLYASAIFIGWVGVLLGLILERIQKAGLGTMVAAIMGFVTLIIAHNLGLSDPDQFEVVRAVLDSNFWLSTHVVVVTMGYAGMFLGGILGIIYCLGRWFRMSTAKRQMLYSICYGVTCFSIVFSFVGTMLGGIWADQSWGRFWGWDPKENGALMIVLWCAIMLHAKWGKLVSEKGFMLMAVFGNVVTSWSWFGTNMLGVGLHSYGFMEGAFWVLLAFIVSQIFIIVSTALLKKR